MSSNQVLRLGGRWPEEESKAESKTLGIEYYSAIKKNEIMPFAATWMDLEIVTLSEVSQTETNKYHMIWLICGS